MIEKIVERVEVPIVAVVLVVFLDSVLDVNRVRLSDKYVGQAFERLYYVLPHRLFICIHHNNKSLKTK